MKPGAKALYASLPLVCILFSACSQDSPLAPVCEPVTGQGHGPDKAVGATAVVSATLHVWALQANGEVVTVHRITAPWEETTTTFNTFNGASAPEVEGTFTVAATGWQTVDVTGLVTAWASGTQPNHGLLLDQPDDATPFAKYRSRESARYHPWLEICYATPAGTACDSVVTHGDTYIWAARPDAINATATELYTGWYGPSPQEKQSLLAFEVTMLPPRDPGCTLTQGYWKTHSEFGPAPYDATWAELPDGASTVFFLSGKSHHEVMWTPPRGNPYYSLAHQYIAAKLNHFAGADFTDAQPAFDAATTIFTTMTPAQVGALRGAAKANVNALASTLDEYNNGLIGPGHCDE